MNEKKDFIGIGNFEKEISIPKKFSETKINKTRGIPHNSFFIYKFLFSTLSQIPIKVCPLLKASIDSAILTFNL